MGWGILALGGVATLLGVVTWAGRLRGFAQPGLAFLPMGLGFVLTGLATLGPDFLFVPALLLLLFGGMCVLWIPPWFTPRWFKEANGSGEVRNQRR